MLVPPQKKNHQQLRIKKERRRKKKVFTIFFSEKKGVLKQKNMGPQGLNKVSKDHFPGDNRNNSLLVLGLIGALYNKTYWGEGWDIWYYALPSTQIVGVSSHGLGLLKNVQYIAYQTGEEKIVCFYGEIDINDLKKYIFNGN